MQTSSRHWRLAALAWLTLGATAWAGESSEFLRISRAGDEPRALEAAIVRYVPDREHADALDGVVVDLVAAVHIGEKSYYDELNRRFEKYDAVLYELVAPEGTKVPLGGGDRGDNLLGALQGGMKHMLGLELQIEQINYERDHFVHADMSPEQFAESMRERGDDFVAMLFRMMSQRMAEQAENPDSGVNDLAMIMAMLSGDGSVTLKRLMAEQFEDLESLTAALDGPDGSTIISERNKVAMGVLKEQLDAGQKRLAIFYGAGHMPDMEKRLAGEFGLVPLSTRWIAAWDLRDPQKQADAEESDAQEGDAETDDAEKEDAEAR